MRKKGKKEKKRKTEKRRKYRRKIEMASERLHVL